MTAIPIAYQSGAMHVALGFAAFLATLAGGMLAFRIKCYVGVLLSFSSGAVLGVAFFDLLPLRPLRSSRC